MLEFLNSLEWPAAFAIVASVVSIITGLFGYVISSRRKAAQVPPVVEHHSEIEKLHSRVNDAVERIAETEGDLKEIRAFIRICQKQLSDHEQRDIDDFKLVEAKVDRLMDIIVRMLQDERL